MRLQRSATIGKRSHSFLTVPHPRQVFSQWTSMLDLVETALRRKGISFVRLDGSTSFQQRGAVLTSFRSDPGVTTLLASTKAGGVGLNLTAASSVVLVDPWWHVHSENQAIDRGALGPARRHRTAPRSFPSPQCTALGRPSLSTFIG